MLHYAGEGELLVVLCGLEHEVLGVEVDHGVEQDLGTVRAQLLGLPQVLLLDARHQIAQLVGGQLEVLHHVVQRRGERLVILVREDIVDAAVLKQVLLWGK